MSAMSSEQELRAFLYKQVAEARRMGEPERVNDLLDKLDNIEELQAFMNQVLQ